MTQDRSLTVTVAEGGLLSLEFIEALAHDRAELSHAPAHYGLGPGVVVLNEIARRWGSLREQWLALRSRDEAARLTGLREAVLKALDLGPDHRQPLPAAQQGARGLEGLTRGERSAALEVRQARRQPDGLEVTPDRVLVWRLDAPAGVREPLDERGYARAEGTTPHAALQGFLNDESGFLWGVLCDGLRLRLLRDHYRISRQAYLEWDLVRMLEEARFYDFKAMWLIAHRETLAGQGGARIEEWGKKSRERGVRAWETLEAGVKDAIRILATGLLHHHRNHALRAELSNPRADAALRLDTDRLYKDCLRLVYRLIFLLVAEAREVLHAPLADDAPDAQARRDAQRVYADHYSVTALARRAARERGGAGIDVWEQLKALFATLCGQHEAGRVALELPLLGSQMWRADFIHPAITATTCANEVVFDALRALCFTREGQVLQPVNWRGLGAEELGSVYEALLGYQMRLPTLMDEHGLTSLDLDRFELVPVGGSERKTSGSYYTPTALVELLLNSALEPVMADALAGVTGGEARAEALLNLKVCDPACGSGHFLLAAANRLAHKVATERAEGEEPTPAAYRHALRQVIARCIYGVDKNEMAVELCKVALWIESVEPGKPLAFLDAHIQQGNSLLGATPAALLRPIPEEAYSKRKVPSKKEREADGYDEGSADNPEAVKLAKERHSKAVKRDATTTKQIPKPGEELPIESWLSTVATQDARAVLSHFEQHRSTAARVLAKLTEDTIDAIQRVEEDWKKYRDSDLYQSNKLLADMWCAAFVWPLQTAEDAQRAPNHDTWKIALRDAKQLPAPTREGVEALAARYHFFHWQLAFPDVFGPPTAEGEGWSGGFDVVLGNPPWKKVKLSDKEFFEGRDAEITATGAAAARRALIAERAVSNRQLWDDYQESLRLSQGGAHMFSNSGLYPLTGLGDLNFYGLFAEKILHITSKQGRSGFIVPTGIVVDATYADFFKSIVLERSLETLFDFENGKLFPKVDSRYRFAAVTLRARGEGPEKIRLAFRLKDPKDLDPARLERLGDKSPLIELTPQDIAAINPNSLTCPIIADKIDARIVLSLYQRNEILAVYQNNRVQRSAWGAEFATAFHMTNDSKLFKDAEQAAALGFTLKGRVYADGQKTMLPTFEGKMVDMFDHRAANIIFKPDNAKRKQQPEDCTLAEHLDPYFENIPFQWTTEQNVLDKIKDYNPTEYFFTFKRVSSALNERAVIGQFVPYSAVSYTLYVVNIEDSKRLPSLAAVMCSFVFDYIVRQKTSQPSLPMGVVYEAAVPSPEIFNEERAWTGGETLAAWVKARVVELTYTAWDMEAFARDCGDQGAPFVWDEARRFKLRAELDAAMCHLYGVTREEDVRYILGTFPIVRDKDHKAYGEYRTCEEIVRVWGAMGRGEVFGYTPGARHPGR